MIDKEIGGPTRGTAVQFRWTPAERSRADEPASRIHARKRSMRKRVAAIWWGLFLLAAACLAAVNVQHYRLRSMFAPLRAAESTDVAFAVKATVHVNELARRIPTGRRDGTGDASSFVA
jgi:hypothetical protein